MPQAYPSIGADLARRLRAGEVVYNATAAVPHPMVIETLARAGFSSLTFDEQHGCFDYGGILACIAAAASAGASAMVRIGLDGFGQAARYLDAGAAGIIAPMINSPADADRLVAATRYPPRGLRSWGPGRALALSGLAGDDYLHGADEHNLVFAMIETQAALDNLDAIATRDGIDGLFVGPLDLSVSLSNGRSLNPDNDHTRRAMERVAETGARHGKIVGAYAASPALAGTYVAQGYRFVAVALDLAILSAGARQTLEAMPGRNDPTVP